MIPTGQRSVELAADDGKRSERGATTFAGGFHQMGAVLAMAEANKVFPKVAEEVGAPVVAATIVVNFADFVGGVHAWISESKATITTGATIDGVPTPGALPSTSIQAWDRSTGPCAKSMAEVILEGQIHSDVSIGKVTAHSDLQTGEKIGNVIAMLGKANMSSRKLATIAAGPAAYEANVLKVAAEANETLLSAMAAEK